MFAELFKNLWIERRITLGRSTLLAILAPALALAGCGTHQTKLGSPPTQATTLSPQPVLTGSGLANKWKLVWSEGREGTAHEVMVALGSNRGKVWAIYLRHNTEIS